MAKGKYLGASRRSLLQQFGAAAIGVTFAGGLSACNRGGNSGRVVNFYNWDTYIGNDTLPRSHFLSPPASLGVGQREIP